MLRWPGRLLIIAGAALLLLLLIGRTAAAFYTDVLWFGALGYLPAFWTRFSAGLIVRAGAGLLGAGLVFFNLWYVARQLGPVRLRRRYGNLEIAEQIPRGYIMAGVLAVSVLAGWWLGELKFGGGASLAVVAWLRQAPWGVADPLFGHDIGFYIFSLPVFFQIVDHLLLVTLWTSVLVGLGYILMGAIRWRENRIEMLERPRLHLVAIASAFILLLGARYWLGRYGLVLDGTGIGGGLGYTDVAARLPAHRVVAILSIVTAGAILYGALRRSWIPPLLSGGALVAAVVVGTQLYPAFVQKFQVEPNQFAREAPYIRWNMEFTRRAYGLDGLERTSFAYRRNPVLRWDDLAPSLSRLPLWDPEQLETAYNQIQAIFGYYHFPHVDYDRYGPPGQAEQVAIAVREFHLRGLAESAQTWQTLRLNPNYVRGMGAVVTPAARASVQGEPLLWIGNLNPVERDPAAPPQVDLVEPSVYFAETMTGYAVLIPGRDSAFVGAPGRHFPAGVELSSFPRLLAFAWRFQDKNLLFSGEISRDSRMVFRRALRERIRTLAPFFLWDADPYPVIHEGRLVWIVDGYAASPTFPLARSIEVEGIGRVRYLRNSMKATVDAVSGDVAFYAVDDDDPILATYRRIFPDLIRPLDAMPAPLRNHLRYPATVLRAQADILQEYHLERPESFYAGQDVWQLPQVQGRDGLPRVHRPAHSLMRLPGSDRVEYLVSAPFIARQRLNMTALLVARSDPPHYGELLLLELPRDQQIPGPTQVEALIEQDPVISAQLALWRQAGSAVEMGHLRVVPLDSAFLYVKPLYLSAQGSPIPQLRRVVVSDGERVSMEPTLADAVRALHEAPDPAETTEPVREPAFPLAAPDEWSRRALQLFEQAEEHLRRGDWAAFGVAWTELQDLLRALAREPGP